MPWTLATMVKVPRFPGVGGAVWEEEERVIALVMLSQAKATRKEGRKEKPERKEIKSSMKKEVNEGEKKTVNES